jgi:anti-anti-sigma factor
MELRVEDHGDACVIFVKGRIDTANSDQFLQRVQESLLTAPKSVIIELSELEYVSSAGLRSLMVIGKKVGANGGKLCCCAMQEMVGRVFEIAGFARLIKTYGTLDEARTGA